MKNAADTIAKDCLAVRLRRLNRIVSNLYDDAFRPLGVRVSQVNILVVVAKRGPIRPTEIARILDIDTSTLSRNLERMVNHGWIRVAAGKDARSQPVAVTPEGSSLLSQVLPLWRKSQHRAAEILGERGVSFLKAVKT